MIKWLSVMLLLSGCAHKVWTTSEICQVDADGTRSCYSESQWEDAE